jgi:arylsulfatase A-like enzyme
MNRPNILFVVLDACRLDKLRSHAPTIVSLSESNLWFEKAIAPAPWTIPSHASLFTGEYPHQHGTHSPNHGVDPSPLVTALQNDGYNCYGVSGNGFVAHETGFDEPFDEFQFTADKYQIFSDGIAIGQYLKQYGQQHPTAPRWQRYRSLVGAACRNDHPIRSLLNVGAAGLDQTVGRLGVTESIPHPLFNSDNSYSYDPRRHTARIESILEHESTSDRPFFLFTNYMDTHRPYMPPEKWQREQFGRSLSYNELRRLNETVAHPWTYIDRYTSNQIDSEDVELVRELYAGAVRSVDEEVSNLIELLERKGLREETLVVVTADHGENLGETDRMGRNRMGHEASMSDNVLRVPLLIAHPDLPSRSLHDPFSLKDLYSLFIEHRDGLSTALDRRFAAEERVVASQYPAFGDAEAMAEQYPNVPETIRNQRSTTHSVAGYSQGWKVVFSSDGSRYVWQNGEAMAVEAVPEYILTTCEQHLESLVRTRKEQSLSEDEKDRLQALGYL